MEFCAHSVPAHLRVTGDKNRPCFAFEPDYFEEGKERCAEKLEEPKNCPSLSVSAPY